MTGRGLNGNRNRSRITVRQETGIDLPVKDNLKTRHHAFALTGDRNYFLDVFGDPLTNEDWRENYSQAAYELDEYYSIQDNPFPYQTYNHMDQLFQTGRASCRERVCVGV